jgi:hypothetical protein
MTALVSIKRAMARLLVLLLGFATLLDVTSVGEPSHQRYGVGAQWLLYGQRYSFYGVTGRMEMRASSVVAVLFEAGLSITPDGDDYIAFADGSVLFSLGPTGEKVYLGLGVGFARWEDRQGWDRGIWHQAYKKLIIGKDFSEWGLPLFLQASLGFDSWFNSIIVAGVWF